MSTQVFPLLNRSQVPTPPDGYQYVFYDKDNGNALTSKSSQGYFQVLQSNPIMVDTSCICNLSETIVKAGACSMEKGIITAEQFESIADNINLYMNAIVDPVSGSYQISVTNTETLFISMALTHVLCNGGSTGTATPTVTGGTAPYTYVWDGGAGNPAALPAGSHNLTVTDANGKTKAVNFIINEPPALTATSSQTPETGGGSNGTATVVASGGTAPYTYLWDDPGAQTTPTATGLAAGNYNCTITDVNLCTLIVPVTVL